MDLQAKQLVLAEIGKDWSGPKSIPLTQKIIKSY